MSLALCPQIISQAPQHFRSSEMQTTSDGCFACQSVCWVISLYGKHWTAGQGQAGVKHENFPCNLVRSDGGKMCTVGNIIYLSHPFQNHCKTCFAAKSELSKRKSIKKKKSDQMVYNKEMFAWMVYFLLLSRTSFTSSRQFIQLTMKGRTLYVKRVRGKKRKKRKTPYL